MIGVFHTRDTAQACRVLAALEQQGLDAVYEYKDGWYEILLPGDYSEQEASQFHRFARTVANTNLKPGRLGEFKQCA